MTEKYAHCEKHDEYTSWCSGCISAEADRLDDENDAMRKQIETLISDRVDEMTALHDAYEEDVDSYEEEITRLKSDAFVKDCTIRDLKESRGIGIEALLESEKGNYDRANVLSRENSKLRADISHLVCDSVRWNKIAVERADKIIELDSEIKRLKSELETARRENDALTMSLQYASIPRF